MAVWPLRSILGGSANADPFYILLIRHGHWSRPQPTSAKAAGPYPARAKRAEGLGWIGKRIGAGCALGGGNGRGENAMALGEPDFV